jgi:DNA-binding MarR family transcriptional regulator
LVLVEALDLIVLGRQLVKIGEQAMRGSSVPALPTGQSLVLRDVFAHPGSAISEITTRTGLPQSYVSESVARLREAGLLETAADSADGRRTLVRVSDTHARTVAKSGSISVDSVLADALNGIDAGRPLEVLESLAKRLRPAEPGPILRALDAAR